MSFISYFKKIPFFLFLVLLKYILGRMPLSRSQPALKFQPRWQRNQIVRVNRGRGSCRNLTRNCSIAVRCTPIESPPSLRMIVLLGKNLSKAWHGSIVEVTFVIFFFYHKRKYSERCRKIPVTLDVSWKSGSIFQRSVCKIALKRRLWEILNCAEFASKLWASKCRPCSMWGGRGGCWGGYLEWTT